MQDGVVCVVCHASDPKLMGHLSCYTSDLKRSGNSGNNPDGATCGL